VSGDHPAWESAPARFLRLARAFPDRLALHDERERLSYGALAERALETAAAVAATPAQRIALLCDHQNAAIVAWLAVLLAGKTAVPLDPTHPSDRLAWMLADARAGALLASPEREALARSLAGDTCPLLPWHGVTPANLPPVDPDAVAYLLYTSGSTGRPKGVIQSHRGLLQHMRAYGESLDLGPDDRLTLLPTYSVDAGLMDIFGALLHGASLHLWDLRRRGAEGLPAWILAREITVLHATPTVFRHLLAEATEPLRFPTVRRVVLGGEPARPGDLLAFRRHFCAPARLINGYGPTEHTVALQASFDTESETDEDPLPLGEPVPGVEVLLLDEEGNRCDDEGEMALRSAAVALGYWDRPELDQRAFLPDPDGGARRIYRSGDRARRRTDRGFSFVGRRDHQIKIQGNRIELGEIESTLRAHPAVDDAVVLVETGPLGDPLLVAHALSPGAAVGSPALLAWLRGQLPAPMVPAQLWIHASWPRTSSGKVDRQALRVATTLSPPAPPTRPLTPTEAWLSGLFAELLGDPSPGPESSFFALGGHSLTAARLLSRLRGRFPQALSPALIFDHPTLAALAAALDALPSLAEGSPFALSPSAPAISPLPPAERAGLHPLSFAQERLWFFERLRPGCPVYHLPLALRLTGHLDRQALSRALAELVNRHEALRTQIIVVDDTPLQRIAPPWTPSLDLVSLRHLPAPARLAHALSLAAERAREPFDLGRGALLRAALFDLGEGDTLLLLVVHHLAADGWAARLLLDELSALYSAACQGLPAPLPPPILQPIDVACSQRAALTPAREAYLLAAWRERLDGAPPLDLPCDHPRPPLPSLRGRIHRFDIPAPLAAGLRALAERAGVTLFMTFLGAFALLLSRHTQREDLVIATAGAGRARPELEGLVGTLVNTLLLRVDLGPSTDVRSLLAQARAVSLGAQALEELPFERLVAAQNPERSPGREPLFQAMLLVDQRPPPLPFSPDLAASRLDLHLGTSLCDLGLTVLDEGALHASFEYAEELFDDATITRLGQQLCTLLDAMVTSPEQAIHALPLLSREERRALLAESWGPRRAVDLDAPLAALIEAQAARTPEATAVVFEGEELSYGTLLTAAQAIAARLRARGVGRGSLVPLPSVRSLDLVPTWLGALLTGAAFVPLDPRWPKARLEAAHRQAALPLDLGPLGPEDPLYGFFTSGSTGVPRLALIPRRGIHNRFAWMDEAFGPTPPVTLATTAPTFDSAVWQLLWPLTRGGRVVIPPDAPLLSARELLSLVERHRVTILDFVPSVLDALLDTLLAPGNAARLASVEHIILGGEAIRPASCLRLQRALPRVQSTNLYGPTEASIGCIAHRLSAEEGQEIPIGKPISNVTALLLDRRGRLVPPGAAGEVTLGGACVGLGYHGDPAATERAFFDNPFPELDTARLYRTGDRARRRADGSLLFLGRLDEQIKLRGIRIEPGEIERAIEQHPSIREAAVEKRALPGGEALLVAHLAPGPLPGDLDTFLRARLPAPLVPQRFLSHPALPRSAAGKLDRGALSAFPLAPEAHASGEAPRGEIEQLVAAAWAELLGIDAPPRDAGFFQLGGHSLQLVMLAGRLERALGREIPLIELFRHPSIRAFAAWLGGDEETRADTAPTRSQRSEALQRLRGRRGRPG
jgi:amino acid adenylation domain-containing protein